MSNEIINFIYNLDEEDLLIDELSVIDKNFVKVFPGEYIDTKIDMVFYETKNLLNIEVENRIKNNNKFLPVILGKSINSCLNLDSFYNCSLILERPDSDNLSNILKRKELKISDILNLIKKLIHFYDFFNTRNLFFGILNLDEIFYDKNSQEMKVIKYPLDITHFEINNEEKLKKFFNKESLILLAPEIIKAIKQQQNYELSSVTESWTLGMLIYQILENKPFFEINESSKDFTLEILMNIDNQTISNKINGLNYNQNIKNLLKKLLKSDKRQRLCTKLIKQTFLKRININELENNGFTNNNNLISSEANGTKNLDKFDFMFKLSQIHHNKTNNDISVIEIAKDNYNTLNKSDIFYEEINQSSTKLLKESESEKTKENLLSNKQTVPDLDNKDSDLREKQSNLFDEKQNVDSKINKELLNFENKDICLFSGKTSIPEKEIKFETTNSNNNLNTEDKTITDFKEMINLTKLVELNNNYNESSLNKNYNNDVTLKLTNSDFDKKLNNNGTLATQEKNLIELGEFDENDYSNKDLIKNVYRENDLINFNGSGSGKEKIYNLILIDKSAIYEEIPEETNETIYDSPTPIKETNFYPSEEKNQQETYKINPDIAQDNIKTRLDENPKEEYYFNNISSENIYRLETNEFNLYTENTNQNDKIERSISKSDNLTLDISNCESKGLDLINAKEDFSDKSAAEKDILIISNNSICDSKEEKSHLLAQSIVRMEKLSLDFIKTNSANYLEEIECLIKKNEASIEAGNLELFEKISPNLWESLMLLAFKFLENDDIKNHYLISKILYNSYDKVIKDKSINVALAKFHFAKSQKDYNSNFSLSLNLFNESFDLIKSLGEANTQLGLTVKFYLGTLYDDMGLYDESVDILLDVLQNQIKIFTNEENIFVARTYNCLGIAEDNRGNLRPAREYYQKAYRIFKFLSYGIETVDSAKVLNNLAGIYYRWEDFTTSLKLYNIVLNVYEKKFGNSNNYVSITYNNIGNCYQMIGDNKKALFYLNKALENFIELFGQSHPQTAMSYKNLGDLYLNLNEKKKALEMFSSCVNVFKDKYGEDNDTYLTTLGKIRKLKVANNL